MDDLILHYFHDPLCGWCYGAAPLLQATRHLCCCTVVLHGGGLFMADSRRPTGPAWRDLVVQHDRRIEERTGQRFMPAYYQGPISDPDTWLDSGPPTAAVLAAEALAGRGLEMLGAQQRAWFQDGRNIMEAPVLQALAEALGLEPQAFRREWLRCSGGALSEHVAETRERMRYAGLSGFPSFLLERQERVQRLDSGQWLGRPHEFAAWLAGQASGLG